MRQRDGVISEAIYYVHRPCHPQHLRSRCCYRGVSGQGGCLPRWVSLQGGVCPGGWGFSAQGRGVCPEGVSAQDEGVCPGGCLPDTPPGTEHRRLWKHYLAAIMLRTVINSTSENLVIKHIEVNLEVTWSSSKLLKNVVTDFGDNPM